MLLAAMLLLVSFERSDVASEERARLTDVEVRLVHQGSMILKLRLSCAALPTEHARQRCSAVLLRAHTLMCPERVQVVSAERTVQAVQHAVRHQVGHEAVATARRVTTDRTRERLLFTVNIRQVALQVPHVAADVRTMRTLLAQQPRCCVGRVTSLSNVVTYRLYGRIACIQMLWITHK